MDLSPDRLEEFTASKSAYETSAATVGFSLLQLSDSKLTIWDEMVIRPGSTMTSTVPEYWRPCLKQ
jgi:hypothetical protein